MRILYHHRTQCLDGQRVHIRAIQDALRAAGHEVLEVAPVEATEVAGAEPVPTWRRRVLGLLARLSPPGVYELMELTYNVVGYRQLARAIRRFRPDFIYERYALNTVAGAWAARRFGLPLLLEVNSPLAMEKRRLGQLALHRLSQRLENRILRQATRVLAVTGVLRDLLCAQADLPEDRVLVVHNGVHPDVLEAAARQRDRLRRALGLHDRVVIGSVGFFRPWHGIELVLEAIARNQELRDRAALLLVGTDETKEGLKNVADRCRIAAQVVLPGSVPHDQVPGYLAAMDIGLVCRAVEYASPLKLFEYLAAGKAVVAPRQANLMEILTDGVDALCFTPEDSAGLEDCLVRLVRDAGLRQRLGDEARQTIRRRGLTWDGNAARIIQVYEELTARPEPCRLVEGHA